MLPASLVMPGKKAATEVKPMEGLAASQSNPRRVEGYKTLRPCNGQPRHWHWRVGKMIHLLPAFAFVFVSARRMMLENI